MPTFIPPIAAKPVPQSSSRGGLTGYLQDKTGVTGAWTLGVGVTAYLISKELYVINSEVSFFCLTFVKFLSFFADYHCFGVWWHCVLDGEEDRKACS